MKSLILLITFFAVNGFAQNSFEIIQNAVQASSKTAIADSDQDCSIAMSTETVFSFGNDGQPKSAQIPTFNLNKKSGIFFKSSENICVMVLTSAISEIEPLNPSTIFFTSAKAAGYISFDKENRITSVSCQSSLGAYTCMATNDGKNKLQKLDKLF